MADKTNEILNQLLLGQKHLESDVSELKTDVAELKEGQKRTELFLLNMENRIMQI